MKLKSVAISVLTAVVIGLLGCGIYPIQTRKKSIDTIPYVPQRLKEWVESSSTIGIVVGLIDNGKINYYSYGKKSIDFDEPVTEKTVFEIGSITKVFTTLLLMEMANEGIIKLDDPIERWS